MEFYLKNQEKNLAFLLFFLVSFCCFYDRLHNQSIVKALIEEILKPLSAERGIYPLHLWWKCLIYQELPRSFSQKFDNDLKLFLKTFRGLQLESHKYCKVRSFICANYNFSLPLMIYWPSFSQNKISASIFQLPDMVWTSNLHWGIPWKIKSVGDAINLIPWLYLITGSSFSFIPDIDVNIVGVCTFPHTSHVCKKSSEIFLSKKLWAIETSSRWDPLYFPFLAILNFLLCNT